jgi:hypothetical protein
MRCDEDHDIFAVALMRTWVSKVSALCRYSASSAVQAVQAVQTGLDLEAHPEFDEADTTVQSTIHEQHLPPSRPGWLGRLTQLVVDTYLLRTYFAEPAGDLLYMVGLGEEMQPP